MLGSVVKPNGLVAMEGFVPADGIPRGRFCLKKSAAFGGGTGLGGDGDEIHMLTPPVMRYP